MFLNLSKIILIWLLTSGATYDVDTTGGGDYTTIAQVNAANFSAWDIIRFRWSRNQDVSKFNVDYNLFYESAGDVAYIEGTIN